MAQTKRRTYFDEYKTIKDEIIEISEQRFENILTKRLKDFKIEIMQNIDKKIDSLKIEMRWLIGLPFIVMTLLMTVYKFIK